MWEDEWKLVERVSSAACEVDRPAMGNFSDCSYRSIKCAFEADRRSRASFLGSRESSSPFRIEPLRGGEPTSGGRGVRCSMAGKPLEFHPEAGQEIPSSAPHDRVSPPTFQKTKGGVASVLLWRPRASGRKRGPAPDLGPSGHRHNNPNSSHVSNLAQTRKSTPVILYSAECVERVTDRQFLALILRSPWVSS